MENMKVCLCGIAKNENNYIREWVRYHKKLGFNNIFIYDNNDTNGETFDDVLAEEIKNGYVKIIDVRNKSNQQITCYNQFYHTYANDYDYVAFFDIDEFLHLENIVSIQEFIQLPIFKKYDGIAINWKQYDDNDLVDVVNNDYGCLKRFTRPWSENTHEQYATCKCTKRILKTKLDLVINSSHGAVTQASMNEYKNLGKNKISLCNSVGEPIQNCIYIQNWTHKNAYLKHFRYKTIGEYIKNKMQRGYPTLYKNEGKNLNLWDFFEANTVTQAKLQHAKKFISLSESEIQKLTKHGVNDKKSKKVKPKTTYLGLDLFGL